LSYRRNLGLAVERNRVHRPVSSAAANAGVIETGGDGPLGDEKIPAVHQNGRSHQTGQFRQIEIAELIVLAKVTNAHAPVTVEEVLFPEKDAPVKPGETLSVAHLGDCRPSTRFALRKDDEVQPDLSGPGSYLIPLRKNPKTDGYEVVPIPPSPSYSRDEGPPRIYPVEDPRLRGQTLAQLRQILAAK